MILSPLTKPIAKVSKKLSMNLGLEISVTLTTYGATPSRSNLSS